mgnify:CR=1 FL=1
MRAPEGARHSAPLRAHRVPPPGEHRRPASGARHSGPSRKVRLRRTLAVTLLLFMVIVTTVELIRGGDPSSTQAAAAVPASSAPQAPSPVPTSTTPTNAAEGVPAAASLQATSSVAGTATPSPTPSVPVSGSGAITLIELPNDATWSEAASGRLVRVAIGAEGGTGADSAEFARTVAATLTDARGWQERDGVRFRFVTPAQEARGDRVDLTVVLASPTFTDQLCAPLETGGEVSCHNNGRVVINARRWLTAVPWFGGDIELYRHYVVNHEVGHSLGHGHLECRGNGQRSPIMAQQSLGLGGCLPWGWPVGDGS